MWPAGPSSARSVCLRVITFRQGRAAPNTDHSFTHLPGADSLLQSANKPNQHLAGCPSALCFLLLFIYCFSESLHLRFCCLGPRLSARYPRAPFALAYSVAALICATGIYSFICLDSRPSPVIRSFCLFARFIKLFSFFFCAPSTPINPTSGAWRPATNFAV